MSIIAILAAILSPAIVATRKAIDNSVASSSGKQLFQATSMYAVDSDDLYPLAMYSSDATGFQTWFGLQTGQATFDHEQGILSRYLGGKIKPDPTHHAAPYLGDMSGFGYNYGYIGSDFSITGDYSHWPNCVAAANTSSLSSPTKTILFASSAFYNATWLPNGDGKKYDFGFVDPPSGWNGNPNMDFRHFDNRRIDEQNRKVTTDGRAVCVFSDGHVESLKQSQVSESLFQRDPGLTQ